MKTKAQLITTTVSVKDVDKAMPFYSSLLGVELARSLTDQIDSFHAIASAGVQFVLNRQQANETVVCSFAVDNLNATIADLQGHGGKLVAGPFDLPIAPAGMDDFKASYKAAGHTRQVGGSMGSTAIVQDPEGNNIALVQLAPFAQDAFTRGELNDDDVKHHSQAVNNGKKVGRPHH